MNYDDYILNLAEAWESPTIEEEYAWERAVEELGARRAAEALAEDNCPPVLIEAFYETYPEEYEAFLGNMTLGELLPRLGLEVGDLLVSGWWRREWIDDRPA